MWDNTCDLTIQSSNLHRLQNSQVDPDSLINILQQVDNTLSSIPDGSYPVAITGALCSVIAAFIFNAIYWKVIDLKKKLSSEVSKFEVVLDRFEKTATEYWMYPYSKRNSKGILIKEMRMKAELRLLRDSHKKIAKRILRSKNKSCFEKIMTKHLSKLYDSATGGDFETTKRKEDLKRCGEIIRICTQLRVEVTGIDQ